MGFVFLYLSALLGKWWLVVTGGAPLVADQLLQLVSRRFKEWVDRRGPWRRRMEVAFLLGAVVWAGYAAWADQYAETQAAFAKKNWWSSVAEDRRIQIEGKNGKGGLEGQLKAANLKLASLQEKLDTANKALSNPGRTHGSGLAPLPSAVPPQDHSAAIAALAALVQQGNEIQSEFIQKNDAALIERQYSAWIAHAHSVLLKQLDASYVAQFDSAQGNGQQPLGRSYEGGAYYARIGGKTEVLSKFVEDLRR